MNPKLIERFFVELDRELARPAGIILTGAACGVLYGNIRPSLDIDFEIRFKGKKTSGRPGLLRRAVEKASAAAGLAANYSEDIGHWSMISFLDYRRHTLPFKKIGALEIGLMAPEYWTIGKMGRFLELDIRDMVKIIQKKKLPAPRLAKLWGKALARSPLSLASGQFRDHVIYFFNRHGKLAWGKGFQADRTMALFKKTAGIAAEES